VHKSSGQGAIQVKKILVQFDTDTHESVFDRVVAVDAGVDELFSYGGIHPDNVTPLVHGAIFTRGPADLKNTAVFIGGSNVVEGEKLLAKVRKAFFGPMQVSVMMDSNGCNTTAAAAVAIAGKHLSLKGAEATVLGATGPVGFRAAQLLAREGAHVSVVSRTLDRASAAVESILEKYPDAKLRAVAADTSAEAESCCRTQQLVIAAGAAGVCFLQEGALSRLSNLKLAIDLNAVPPVGIADIKATAKAVDHSGTVCYGALGVGGLKMKVHRLALQNLFEANDRVLDVESIYDLALQLVARG
jgi:hypothetical protein